MGWEDFIVMKYICLSMSVKLQALISISVHLKSINIHDFGAIIKDSQGIFFMKLCLCDYLTMEMIVNDINSCVPRQSKPVAA